MNYYRGDIVTDLESVNRYKVLADNGDTIDVSLIAKDSAELDGTVLECDKSVFTLVKRPMSAQLDILFSNLASLMKR